ncbi:MAG: Fic family protein [Methylococcales bacterium]
MAVKIEKKTILAVFDAHECSLSLPELAVKIDHTVSERTLRRWLAHWVDEGILRKSGHRRSTRYELIITNAEPTFQFLIGLSPSKKTALIKQLRDLWTHTSTAIEGNTLTLGDTHFVLEEGLTIFGTSIKDHQEVIGHAKAIDILYQSLNKPITERSIFDLHKAVQTDNVTDIYKPNGLWKIEPNGTYVVTKNDEQVYIEYALPSEVPYLMREILIAINAANQQPIEMGNAHNIYAKLHVGLAHTHPFWDGNGRIARLLSNIPLLRAGLPPIVIPKQERKIYIQLLAEYQLSIGQISQETGVWPKLAVLIEFEEFIERCYSVTKLLVEKAHQ